MVWHEFNRNLARGILFWCVTLPWWLCSVGCVRKGNSGFASSDFSATSATDFNHGHLRCVWLQNNRNLCLFSRPSLPPHPTAWWLPAPPFAAPPPPLARSRPPLLPAPPRGGLRRGSAARSLQGLVRWCPAKPGAAETHKAQGPSRDARLDAAPRLDRAAMLAASVRPRGVDASVSPAGAIVGPDASFAHCLVGRAAR